MLTRKRIVYHDEFLLVVEVPSNMSNNDFMNVFRIAIPLSSVADEAVVCAFALYRAFQLDQPSDVKDDETVMYIALTHDASVQKAVIAMLMIDEYEALTGDHDISTFLHDTYLSDLWYKKNLDLAESAERTVINDEKEVVYYHMLCGLMLSQATLKAFEDKIVQEVQTQSLAETQMIVAQLTKETLYAQADASKEDCGMIDLGEMKQYIENGIYRTKLEKRLYDL